MLKVKVFHILGKNMDTKITFQKVAFLKFLSSLGSLNVKHVYQKTFIFNPEPLIFRQRDLTAKLTLS